MSEQQVYGKFSEDGKEYIIQRPDTPRPWVNFLFNGIYHAIVSQTGGGFSYYKDPKYNRILRYNSLVNDRPGRYLFLHDSETKKAWSANWQPMKKEFESYECRHGIGYTTIKTQNEGILSTLTYLVTQKDPAEIMLVKVKNTTDKKRKLKVFPFADIISGNIAVEVVYPNILCLYNRAVFNEKDNTILAYKMPFPHRPEEDYTFFYSSKKAEGYDLSKEKFCGRYKDLVEGPDTVLNGKCQNSEVDGEDMIATFEHTLELDPGEEQSFVIVLGFVGKQEEVATLVEKYGTVEKTEKELSNIKAYWEERLSSIVVDTPDENFNLMINTWGRYQLFAITHWRGTSHYHGGDGGLGYRDTAQDIEGLLALDMEIAMHKMQNILYYQYNCGHAVSGFSEIEGPWENIGEEGVTGKADVAVWLPYTVISYLKETGDYDFLKKECDFFDGGKATVYEHILRAVRYIYSQRGADGLPYICKADWNDAYDMVGKEGKGQSIWLGMALARACLQMKELADFIKDSEVSKEMSDKYQELKEIINTVGWDGDWYLAAINDTGFKIGSHKNEEGNVPLNSQTWAILSETVTDERLPKILDKIDNYLDTDYGPALFLPSYTKWNPGIGRVTSFAPGTKENAAVFSHACAFKIVSDCTIGRGTKAYETFSKLIPNNDLKTNNPENYKAEPYVFAEYVIGPGSQDRFGEGAFTWNTGTVPWVFIAATEWILGARRDFDGLRIDPCLPQGWKKCSIRRPFRGAIYEISIDNPEGLEKGVKKVVVDGKELKGTLITPHGDGKVHKVEVLMGK